MLPGLLVPPLVSGVASQVVWLRVCESGRCIARLVHPAPQAGLSALQISCLCLIVTTMTRGCSAQCSGRHSASDNVRKWLQLSCSQIHMQQMWAHRRICLGATAAAGFVSGGGLGRAVALRLCPAVSTPAGLQARRGCFDLSDKLTRCNDWTGLQTRQMLKTRYPGAQANFQHVQDPAVTCCSNRTAAAHVAQAPARCVRGQPAAHGKHGTGTAGEKNARPCRRDWSRGRLGVPGARLAAAHVSAHARELCNRHSRQRRRTAEQARQEQGQAWGSWHRACGRACL